MGTTLRNIFLLLLFAVLATKGLEHLPDFAPGPADERARVVTAQDIESYQADESYIAHDQLVLQATRNGHFTLEASVDGTPIEFMVDTGASIIVLSPADAQLGALGGSCPC